MINLTVNGKPTELQHPIPLLQYLHDRGVNTHFIAVAYNGTVLPREELGNVTLNQGDVVEIVRPVGGG